MYLFGSCVELPAHFFCAVKSVNSLFVVMGVFCLGCLVIGLILIDHDHCEVGGGGGGAHEGHNH
jgi:hypothetical protein